MQNKKAFSLLELIFAIFLIGVITAVIIPENKISKLQLATDKLITNLNYTRYIAMLDDKQDIDDNEWEKKRWTLKFQNCSEQSKKGIYYTIYSDSEGGTGHFYKTDTLKDPLTQKFLYVSNTCEIKSDESSDVLLTQNFGIEQIDISCNTTSGIGQISFGEDGRVYSQLGQDIKSIDTQCSIRLIDIDGKYKTIIIEPVTGYIYAK